LTTSLPLLTQSSRYDDDLLLLTLLWDNSNRVPSRLL